MNNWTAMFFFAMLAVAASTAAVTSAAALNAPEPVTITKTIEVMAESDKACMRRNEAGKVMAVSLTKYSEATKEEPEAFSYSTFVTFKMANGISRVCHFNHRDITKNMKLGLIFNATSGIKEL